LWNSFEPFWKNEGKTSHSLKEMPSNFFTTYHIKQITKKININKNKISL
jgi:hypothetical protein